MGILSLKVVLISSGVLSMAVILRLSLPVFRELAESGVPSIYSFVILCLKPPYIYLLINFIIITIVASSKFESKVDDSSPPPSLISLPVNIPSDVRDDLPVACGVVDLKNEVAPAPVFEIENVVNVDPKISETKSTVIADKLDEFVVSKSLNKDTQYVLSNEKPPPVSTKFGHRKGGSGNGNGRSLGVSKPKRHETLENTWKTITDGREMPLARHLKKSDTWETRNNHHQQHMTKSETFKDSTNNKSSLRRSGKLRKEVSPGQEELNRRVEAFINKFNEDMRLQRQESLHQYMEMIKRGVH